MRHVPAILGYLLSVRPPVFHVNLFDKPPLLSYRPGTAYENARWQLGTPVWDESYLVGALGAENLPRLWESHGADNLETEVSG